MSNKFNNAVQAIGPTGSHACRLVLWFLADHANDSGVAYASYETLMHRCEIGSRDTVSKCIKFLYGKGIIRIEKRMNNCHKYTLDLKRINSLANADMRRDWMQGAKKEAKVSPGPVLVNRTAPVAAIGGAEPTLLDFIRGGKPDEADEL